MATKPAEPTGHHRTQESPMDLKSLAQDFEPLKMLHEVNDADIPCDADPLPQEASDTHEVDRVVLQPSSKGRTKSTAASVCDCDDHSHSDNPRNWTPGEKGP